MSEDLHLNPLHSRLVELETAFAFQQKLVEDLNSAVLGQARSLQQLEKQVRTLQEQLSQKPARPTSQSGQSPADDEEDYGE